MWTDDLERASRTREARIRALPVNHPERIVRTLSDHILARHLQKDPTEEPHASEWEWRHGRPYPWHQTISGWTDTDPF